MIFVSLVVLFLEFVFKFLPGRLIPVLQRTFFAVELTFQEHTCLLLEIFVFVINCSQELVFVNYIARSIFVFEVVNETFKVLAFDSTVELLYREPAEDSYLPDLIFSLFVLLILFSLEFPVGVLALLSVLLPLVPVLLAASPVLCRLMGCLASFALVVMQFQL